MKTTLHLWTALGPDKTYTYVQYPREIIFGENNVPFPDDVKALNEFKERMTEVCSEASQQLLKSAYDFEIYNENIRQIKSVLASVGVDSNYDQNQIIDYIKDFAESKMSSPKYYDGA